LLMPGESERFSLEFKMGDVNPYSAIARYRPRTIDDLQKVAAKMQGLCDFLAEPVDPNRTRPCVERDVLARVACEMWWESVMPKGFGVDELCAVGTPVAGAALRMPTRRPAIAQADLEYWVVFGAEGVRC